MSKWLLASIITFYHFLVPISYAIEITICKRIDDDYKCEVIYSEPIKPYIEPILYTYDGTNLDQRPLNQEEVDQLVFDDVLSN